MNDLDQLQNKYLVIKWKDIETFLGTSEQMSLEQLLGTIEDHREDRGKPRTNDYVVINTDESYIQEIIDIMKKHGHWG